MNLNKKTMTKKIVALVAIVLFAKVSFGQNFVEHFKLWDALGGVTFANGNQITIGDSNPTGSPTHVFSMDTLTDNNYSSIAPCIGFALNLPFISFKESSVGTHIGGFFNKSKEGMAINFPVMLQYRFGTDAVLDSDKDFGFALSLGYNMFFATGDGMGEGKFFYPSISPEINYNIGGWGLTKIRAYFQFGTKRFEKKQDNEILISNTKIPFVICIAICPHY